MIKRRWCAWDSNPGWQNGRRRRIHWAMSAAHPRRSFVGSSSPADAFSTVCYLLKIGHFVLIFAQKEKNFFLSLPPTFFHFERLLFCSVTRLGDFKRILETNFLTKSGPNTYLGTFWGILKNVTFEVKNALATFG